MPTMMPWRIGRRYDDQVLESQKLNIFTFQLWHKAIKNLSRFYFLLQNSEYTDTSVFYVNPYSSHEVCIRDIFPSFREQYLKVCHRDTNLQLRETSLHAPTDGEQ